MAKRRNKAAKIRAVLADNPDATAKEIIQTLAAQRVRVTAAQVYNVKSTMAKPKLDGYASLNQAKKLADALGGVEEARAALDVLARLHARRLTSGAQLSQDWLHFGYTAPRNCRFAEYSAQKKAPACLDGG